MRSNFVASPACTVLFLGFFSIFAPLYVSAEDDVIDITPEPGENQYYADPHGDYDDDGFLNGEDRCPKDAGAKAPGCPSCEDTLKRFNITDLDDYLAQHNFGLVVACGDGRMIYRCSKPDETLAVVVRDCKGVSDFICLAGDAIGISQYEKMVDNRCRHLSEESCLASDIHFYNECRPALVGDVDFDKLKEALTRAYTVHKGNTLLHCYHGVDRTGFISAIMVALNVCTGLPHPLKELCTIGVRIFYFDSNPIFGGSSRFPALAQSYNECVNAIVPGAGVSILTPLVKFPPLAPPPQPQTPDPTPERPVR